MGARPDRWRKWLDVITTLAVLVACLVLLWRIWPRSQPDPSSATALAIPAEPVSLADAQTKGSPTAQIGLLMFMDYQCPFCRRFHQQTLGELERQYVEPGVLLLAFRQLPLTQLHSGAVALAEGATCAGRQGRFWEASMELYRAPKAEPAVLPSLAKSMGLDVRAFERCLSGEAVDQVRRDMLAGNALGLGSTPAFFLGRMDGTSLRVTKAFGGAKPLVAFQKAIEETLSQSK